LKAELAKLKNSIVPATSDSTASNDYCRPLVSSNTLLVRRALHVCYY